MCHVASTSYNLSQNVVAEIPDMLVYIFYCNRERLLQSSTKAYHSHNTQVSDADEMIFFYRWPRLKLAVYIFVFG